MVLVSLALSLHNRTVQGEIAGDLLIQRVEVTVNTMRSGRSGLDVEYTRCRVLQCKLPSTLHNTSLRMLLPQTAALSQRSAGSTHIRIFTWRSPHSPPIHCSVTSSCRPRLPSHAVGAQRPVGQAYPVFSSPLCNFSTSGISFIDRSSCLMRLAGP
jgi:hypothetical protein